MHGNSQQDKAVYDPLKGMFNIYNSWVPLILMSVGCKLTVEEIAKATHHITTPGSLTNTYVNVAAVLWFSVPI